MTEKMSKDKKYYEKHKEELKLKRKLYYQEQKRANEIITDLKKKHPIPYMLQNYKKYRETFPNAKFSDYLDGLNKFKKMKKVESEDAISDIPLEFDIGHFPLNKSMWQKCLIFRTMICRMKQDLFPRDTFFLNEHLLKCDGCSKWNHNRKKGLEVFKPLPFDLFHEHEHIEPKQEPKSGIPQDINEWVESEIERLKRDKPNNNN